MNEEGKGSAYVKWDFMVPSWWSVGEPVPCQADLRLQVTDLAFSSLLAHNRVLIMASCLSTGEPLANAQITLWGEHGKWKTGITDEKGLVSFPLKAGELGHFFRNSEKSLEIELSKGKDRLIFRPYEAPSYNWNFYGPFNAEDPKPLAYICSDRGIYRPGEELSFYGIDRDLVIGKFQPHRGNFTVELRQGWYGDNVLAEASGTLTDSGRFWGKLHLPEDMDPDEYFLVYRRKETPEKAVSEAPVKIAFFRRLNFAVDLSIPETPKFMGDSLEARFSGKYLAGGNVTGGSWNYWWARREIRHAPQEDYYRSFHFTPRGAVMRSGGAMMRERSKLFRISKAIHPEIRLSS